MACANYWTFESNLFFIFFASRRLPSQIQTSVFFFFLREATKDTAGDKIATEPSRQNETLKEQNKIKKNH